ncbi:hypothetical protein ACJIZ3_022733 [Penstemon smallii]|uniref:C2 NT-type domain-containing protein n=1 Tax=Penstemon smallii TaxID=265156 RepID=A0ABD3TM27_9LAMI
MVVKMMKWRPWPPFSSRKFDAKITLHQLRGLQLSSSQLQNSSKLAVEIKWKGSKGIGLSSLRRSVRKNLTKEESLTEDGVVEWNEEFQSTCSFSAYKEGVFHPWEVSFTVFNGLQQGPNNKVPIIASASLNIAEFASKQNKEINIPMAVPGSNTESTISLHLSIVLQELRNVEEPSTEPIQRSILYFPRSPCYGEVYAKDGEEVPARKKSPIRVNIFKGLSALRSKRTSHEESSDGRSEDYPLDTDSLDDSDEGDSEEVKDDSFVRKSFNYGTLAYANHAGAPTYSNTSGSEDEDWIYFSHSKSDLGQRFNESANASAPEQSTNLKRRLLPWRKRKINFKSPKVKGEPLLKKCNGDEGGDDIDFDRRQLSSSDESTLGQKTEELQVVNQPSESAFGDDNFAVGIWETKEIISRDGHMKLKTQVFFASIDQRSERAAGESACTALVAVVADSLQSNPSEMPIKSQLDCLIREGSLEWRNLCNNETYKERFPDKHFDLETVLEAKIRPLSIVPEKSFIGFFHPEGLEDKGFDFLQGAMSFDNIWDEICLWGSEIPPTDDPLVYIISWNDHFFVLKVDQDAYYIIDTLGERLYEGCNEAFILKFDRDTMIHRIDNEAQKSDDKADEGKTGNEESTMVCSGKETCKEYIKSFLAAIPIRELQDDLKKGLFSSEAPLHQRLQIEFHYTKCLHTPMEEHPPAEETDDTPEILPIAALEADKEV